MTLIIIKISTHLIDFLQGLTLTLSALIDGKNFNQGGHKVMATIHQELSSCAFEIQNIYMHTTISFHLLRMTTLWQSIQYLGWPLSGAELVSELLQDFLPRHLIQTVLQVF